MRRSGWIPSLLVLTLAVPAWAGPAAKLDPSAPSPVRLGGGTSPEDVFLRAREAARNDDISGMLRLLAPDAQAELCLMMYVSARMMIAMTGRTPRGARGAEQANQDLRALLKKHGAPEPDPSGPLPDLNDRAARRAAARKMFDGVDFPTFFTDLQAITERLGAKGGGMRLTQNTADGELSDLTLEGDRTTGKVGDRTHLFVRVDGRWYVELED